MSKNPKVSVVTITYNQENYIRQALESFVMQKTNFSFEVVVADDCSRDKTPQIIREFAEKYPDIFRPILRKKNVGAVANSIDSLRAARGKYIALCEGDDYWTDPLKLQKQVDFLETHPKYSLCFHPVRVFFENKEKEDSIYPPVREKERFTTGELLRWNFIQTNSVMYRRQNYDNLPTDILPLDWYYHLYHAQFGKIGYIDEVMSAYRRHAGGIWWNAHKNVEQIWRKYGKQYFKMYVELLGLYGKNEELRKEIFNLLYEIIGEFRKIDAQYGDNLMRMVVVEFPETATLLLGAQQQEREHLKRVVKDKDAIIQAKDQELIEVRKECFRGNDLSQKLDAELQEIKSSRVWKARNKVARLVRKKVI